MKSFPKIKNDEFIVMYCERNTGIVLDVLFNRCINDTQEVYQVFSNLEMAVRHAKNVIDERNYVECNIYDYEKKAILTIDINNYSN